MTTLNYTMAMYVALQKTHISNISIAALSACKAPPHTETRPAHDTIPLSSINVTTTIDMESVRQAMENYLETAPSISGSADQALLNLAGTQDSPTQALEHILVPGYSVNECHPVSIAKSCRKHLGMCIFTGGASATTQCVTHVIPDTFKDTIIVAHHFQDVLMPLRGNIRYNLSANSLKLQAAGDTITLALTFHLKIDLDVTADTFGRNFTVKGALQCESDLTPTVTVKLGLKQNGTQLNPDIQIQDPHLDVGQFVRLQLHQYKVLSI